MRIVVAGPGAIGLFLARRLDSASSTQLLHHDAQKAKVLSEQGFTVVESGIEHKCLLECTVKPPPEADLLIVAVKTYSLDSLLNSITSFKPAKILTIQNGIGNCERLAATFGTEDVYGSTLTYGLSRVSDNRVELRGEGVMQIGKWDGGSCTEIAGLFRNCGINVVVAGSIQRALWLKLGINACINPVAAILDVPNGELLQNEQAQEMWARIPEEIALAARSDDVNIDAKEILSAAKTVAEGTFGNICSMLQDIRAGRRSEIDAICGEPARRLDNAGMKDTMCADLFRKVQQLAGSGKR